MDPNHVLTELNYQASRGALRYKDVRYLLIRPETMIALQKEAEARLGLEGAAELLYAGGFTGGHLSGRHYRTTLGLSAAEAVDFMGRMGGEIGWGRFAAVDLNEDRRRLRLEVHGSPFADAYGPGAAGGVCHLLRGVLGGLLSGLYEAEVRAQETACTAHGDAACRFEVEAVT